MRSKSVIWKWSGREVRRILEGMSIVLGCYYNFFVHCPYGQKWPRECLGEAASCFVYFLGMYLGQKLLSTPQANAHCCCWQDQDPHQVVWWPFVWRKRAGATEWVIIFFLSSVCVCTCACIYTCMHMYACMCTHVHVFFVWAYVHMFMCMYVSVHGSVHEPLCLYMCVSMCAGVWMCIHCGTRVQTQMLLQEPFIHLILEIGSHPERKTTKWNILAGQRTLGILPPNLPSAGITSTW